MGRGIEERVIEAGRGEGYSGRKGEGGSVMKPSQLTGGVMHMPAKGCVRCGGGGVRGSGGGGGGNSVEEKEKVVGMMVVLVNEEKHKAKNKSKRNMALEVIQTKHYCMICMTRETHDVSSLVLFRSSLNTAIWQVKARGDGPIE